jgi:hypothetical protein
MVSDKITGCDHIIYVYIKIWHGFCLLIKLKILVEKALTQASAAQLQHQNKKPGDGQWAPKVILKKGV